MILKDLQKLTLLDFPGQTACTVFTGGCNFRCPFCHNAPLVIDPERTGDLSLSELDAFLRKRQGILDGICVTGGEPLLNPDAAEFLSHLRQFGYKIKLDTNGSFPERLRQIVSAGLVDYVAMDIKNDRARYAVTAGLTGDASRLLAAVEESVAFLLEGRVDYEFRTTVIRELHDEESFRGIGEWIRGCPRYFLQRFTDSGNLIADGYTAPDDEDMRRYLDVVLPFVPTAQLRGV